METEHPVRRRGYGLDLRSRIILVLLVVGALSALGVSWLGFQRGQESLVASITAHLEGRRDLSGIQLEQYFLTVRNHVVALTDDVGVRQALRALPAAMTRLNRIPPPDGAVDGLQAWYRTNFLPGLNVSGGQPEIDSFVPGEYSSRTLQALYVSGSADLDDIPEAQFYAEIHDRIDPSLRGVATSLGYEDVFLIGPGGRVVYSVLKKPDFATDLEDGLYSDTGLARVFRSAREARGARFAAIEDFSFYTPSKGVPAIFLAAPIFDGGLFLGYLAVQLNADRIASPAYDTSGLGETGQVFLVGPDALLRSELRWYREDADRFTDAVRNLGHPTSLVEQVRARDTPIKLLEIRGTAVDRALRGETGAVQIDADFLGNPALAAYRPLNIPGLDWAVIAELPLAEAMAPVVKLGYEMMVTAVVLALFITFFSRFVARSITRPVDVLIDRAKSRLAGNRDVNFVLERSDELGELSQAMQRLADAQEASDNQARSRDLRTEFLLSKFLPDGIARRIAGRDLDSDDLNVIETAPAVAVIYAQIDGFEDLLRSAPIAESVGLVGTLVKMIDDAAGHVGVEKIRTFGGSYVAAAGLSAPQIDFGQRAVDFAMALRQAVARFAAEVGIPLKVRIGIASGSAVYGVIGQDKLGFELLGEPKSDAIALSMAAGPGEIRVSDAICGLTSHEAEHPADGHGMLLVSA